MPFYAWPFLLVIKKYLRQFDKVDQIFFSANSRKEGESKGFNKMRFKIDFKDHEIITYTHSKGTSSRHKNTIPVRDWTELMRYFVIERLDLCKKAFQEGYYLYGVELSNHIDEQGRIEFPETKFIYDGNFVSVNYKALSKQFKYFPCRKHYYGVERFWGQLCQKEKAFCAHSSNTDHYDRPYPPSNYRTSCVSTSSGKSY